jgi:hypothetical protein
LYAEDHFHWLGDIGSRYARLGILPIFMDLSDEKQWFHEGFRRINLAMMSSTNVKWK